MTALLERFTTRNPLLSHGPRSHGTGIELAAAEDDARISVQAPTTWRSFLLADAVAPSTHMGPSFR